MTQLELAAVEFVAADAEVKRLGAALRAAYRSCRAAEPVMFPIVDRAAPLWRLAGISHRDGSCAGCTMALALRDQMTAAVARQRDAWNALITFTSPPIA